VLVSAACSSSGTGSKEGGGGSPAAAGFTGSAPNDVSSVVSQDEALMQKYYEGTNRAPSGEPVPAQKGKKVFVISCGQNIATCGDTAGGVMDAGRLLGWNMTLLDGKGNPSTTSSLVDQALAGGAQGIAVIGFDCSLAQGSYQRAKNANVPVALVYGADCNEPYSPKERPGPSLLNDVRFGGYLTGPQFLNAWARARAQFLIAHSKGKADVISFEYAESPATYAVSRAFDGELAKCEGCKVHVVPFSTAQFGPALQQLAQQAPLKFPDANAVLVANDALYLAGIQAGISASGRSAQLFTVGAEGLPPVLQMVTKGAVGGVMAYSDMWAGFATADTLNSVFAGKKPRDSGIGWQLIDKDHASAIVDGAFKPAVDFVAAYKRLWGVS
jgi:ribose transport system substrate-binding protein